MASVDGLVHAIAFEYNGLLYVIGYRAGGQYLRRSEDAGESWLEFSDGSEETLVAMHSDEQRVALVKMGTQGRSLVVGVPSFPSIDIYVSHDDGESWSQEDPEA